MKIGIIGLGTVGNAIALNVDYPPAKIIDIDSKKNNSNYQEILDTDAIFVCVPSPMNTDKSCNVSILTDVLSKIKNYKGVVISKVTAPPDVYKKLGQKYPNLVHSPEFLKEQSALADYNKIDWAVVGGTITAYMHEAERAIRFTQPGVKKIEFCSLEEASLFKYTVNSFLATKLIFFNEIKLLCDNSDIQFEKLKYLFELEDRLGKNYFNVPGNDGTYGFGGKCLPKDVNAIIRYSEKQKSKLSLLDFANKRNTFLRLK